MCDKLLKNYYLYTPNFYEIGFHQSHSQNPNFPVTVEYFSLSHVFNYKPDVHILIHPGGILSVSKDGIISFSEFRENAVYNVYIKAVGFDEFFPYTITVTKQSDIFVKYYPETQILKYKKNDKTGNDVSIIGGIVEPKVNKYFINNVEHEINKQTYFNTGIINVNENGSIIYGSFSEEATYNIVTNIETYGDIPFTLKILKDYEDEDNIVILWYNVVYYGLELWKWIIIGSVILIIAIILIVYFSTEKKENNIVDPIKIQSDTKIT